MDLKYVCVATVVVIFHQVHMYQTYARTATVWRLDHSVLHLSCTNCTNNARIRLGHIMEFSSCTGFERQTFSQTEASIVYSNCSFKHSCDIHVTRWHDCYQANIQYRCTRTTAVYTGSISSTTQDITSPIVTVTSFQTYHTDNEETQDISTGSSQNQSGFPVGVVVGVAVAVVVLIVVLMLVGYFVFRSRRRAEASTKSVKSTVLNGTYDASSTMSVAGANSRTGKNKLSLQDRLNESDNAIYSEPHDSTYDRNEGEISINDDYNIIDFKTRKQFSVDPGYGTLAADHGFNGGQDYSHICDVTPSQEDTYSHIPAGHALVTSGHENSFDDTDDTYNHLNAGLGNRYHNARPCQDGIYSHIDESKANKIQPSCQDVDHAYWVLEKQ